MGIKQPGQPLTFPARLYNDLVALRDAWKLGRLGLSQRDLNRGKGQLIRNDSGGDLDQFSVLGITGVVFEQSDNAAEFKSNPTLKGTTPVLATDAGKFAVLIEPCKDGKFARCIVDGVTTALVDIIDTDDEYCDIADAQSDTLTSYGLASARIIHKPSGIGDKWCVIQLGVRHGPATRYRGQQVGALLISDANNVVDNLVALDGVPVETSVTVDNVLNWSADDNAPTYIEYNASDEVWEMYNVECGA